MQSLIRKKNSLLRYHLPETKIGGISDCRQKVETITATYTVTFLNFPVHSLRPTKDPGVAKNTECKNQLLMFVFREKKNQTTPYLLFDVY